MGANYPLQRRSVQRPAAFSVRALQRPPAVLAVQQKTHRRVKRDRNKCIYRANVDDIFMQIEYDNNGASTKLVQSMKGPG
jgi:isocitrate dehydrogenase